MPAVALSSRSNLYVPITCAKVRKASHHGIHSRVACLAPHREVQYRDASAVCIAVHGLQVDCIAAAWEAIVVRLGLHSPWTL